MEKKQILIQKLRSEVQIGIVENNQLAELLIERGDTSLTVGNIYLGKVQKILDGLQASFINIGEKTDGFLHFSDIGTTTEDYNDLFLGNDEVDIEEDISKPESVSPSDKKRSNSNSRDHSKNYVHQISSKITVNDMILVQVIKEPIGTKGYRLTSNISIAGRFFVLLPFGGSHFAISKRITNPKEKKRLRHIIRSKLPSKNFGVVIRTAASDQDEEILTRDIEALLSKWQLIEDSVKGTKRPMLIHREENVISATLRDFLSNNIDEIVTNSQAVYKQAMTFLSWAVPHMKGRLQLYKGRLPLFDAYGIAKDAASVTAQKIWLKSGGYIIIEHTEAMVVVDVNTGKYIAKREQEENSLKTNLEAAHEISRQLRLRDIGGIIVIDFIDLNDSANAQKVYEAIKNDLKKDRARSNVLKMSSFGLIEITRERIRPSLIQRMQEGCQACNGTGHVLPKYTTIQKIDYWLRKYAIEKKSLFPKIHLYVNPNLFENKDFNNIYLPRLQEIRWFAQHLVRVYIKYDTTMQLNMFEFYNPKEKKYITRNISTS